MPSRATQKVSNLELRMPYLCNFGNFRLKIRKSDFDISNHHPRIYQNAKDCAKTKIKFGNKLPYLSILGCEFEKYCHI